MVKTNGLDKVFHFSSYWGTWSRVMQFPNKENGEQYIELNLTPIRFCPSSNFEWDVKPIVFRIHRTTPAKKDIFEKILPDSVSTWMKNILGDELVHRLLTEDFLLKIDIDRLRCSPLGGTPLRNIIKV